MCKAFSAVVDRNRNVYWKRGIDSHNELKKRFKLDDYKLGNMMPVEISPKNANYLKPDKWEFKFDEQTPETPDWWKYSHETACWTAFEQWKKEVYGVMDVKGLLSMKNPFECTPPSRITNKHKKLLREWDSVWASVWDSVWDSVWAYAGSYFAIPRADWKYTENIKAKGYPFQPAVELWNYGLVPSFDGETWRLHGGKKAKVLFEVSAKELRKIKF